MKRRVDHALYMFASFLSRMATRVNELLLVHRDLAQALGVKGPERSSAALEEDGHGQELRQAA